MELKLCYIKESYFIEHAHFVKMLDPEKADKQSRRTHLCLVVRNNDNTFYIPLRNNLGFDVRKYGRIGHALPSVKRPSAGLDYRYSLIVNDESYIEKQMEQRIPRSQYNRIKDEYESIENEFRVYINGFIKALRKERVCKEPLYRESSLINFKEILLSI